jgi:hypothetical protein
MPTFRPLLYDDGIRCIVTVRGGSRMAVFNAILVGALGGVLLALVYHLLALTPWVPVLDSLTAPLFLIGWIGSAILILKA